MDGWMHGWMEGWKDGWKNVSVCDKKILAIEEEEKGMFPGPFQFDPS